MDDNQLEIPQSDGRIDEKSTGIFRICGVVYMDNVHKTLASK